MKLNEIKRTLFIDMDDCIVDLAPLAAKFNNISVEKFKAAGWDNRYWTNVKENANIKDFFANAVWLKNGKRLLHWLDERGIQYTFLSRPIRPPNTEACIKGKRLWLDTHGLKDNHAIFAFNKSKYVGKGNILIDDQLDNITDWRNSGGIGLLYNHEKIERTLDQLDKIFKSTSSVNS